MHSILVVAALRTFVAQPSEASLEEPHGTPNSAKFPGLLLVPTAGKRAKSSSEQDDLAFSKINL
jgi:hypothetical protein